nr:PPO-1 [Aphelandra squarrosa]
MASLGCPSGLLQVATNPQNRSPNFSAKPSTYFLTARRRRLNVSCNGGRSPDSGKVDRRNMLLGMGGLYGAANLVSADPQAQAEPIEAPEFTKCGAAHDTTTGNPLDVNCCPPVSGAGFKDYVLPPVVKLKMRPAAHRVTKEQLAKYELAMKRMRDLSVKDPNDPLGFTQQANIHCAYCNGAHDQPGFDNLDIQVHNCWLFFPFHRWYLYFYERILGKLIDDPTFALPFWNWDHPKGMTFPKIYDREGSPLFDVNRDQAHRGPALIDLGFTGATEDLQIISNNLGQMHTEMIKSVNSTLDFMGKVYVRGDQPNNNGGGGTSENGSHVAAHAWVGNPLNEPYHEDMGNFYSAGRDPVFYCHHSNVDRMWAIWKTLDTDVPKQLTDPNFLNATFLFYNENRELVRVKVADCLDQRKMGYDFEKVDTPWKNFRPPKRAERVDIKKIASGAKKADAVFPLNLKKISRVLVPKSAKGKADEVLVLENIVVDSTKFTKFDVYINDEDDSPKELDKAEYAGTFAQVPHKTKDKKGNATINLRLTELYEDIDVGDDDTIVVTLIPRSGGEHVTIGGIKVIPSPPRSGAAS